MAEGACQQATATSRMYRLHDRGTVAVWVEDSALRPRAEGLCDTATD